MQELQKNTRENTLPKPLKARLGRVMDFLQLEGIVHPSSVSQPHLVITHASTYSSLALRDLVTSGRGKYALLYDLNIVSTCTCTPDFAVQSKDCSVDQGKVVTTVLEDTASALIYPCETIKTTIKSQGVGCTKSAFLHPDAKLTKN